MDQDDAAASGDNELAGQLPRVIHERALGATPGSRQRVSGSPIPRRPRLIVEDARHALALPRFDGQVDYAA